MLALLRLPKPHGLAILFLIAVASLTFQVRTDSRLAGQTVSRSQQFDTSGRRRLAVPVVKYQCVGLEETADAAPRVGGQSVAVFAGTLGFAWTLNSALGLPYWPNCHATLGVEGGKGAPVRPPV